MRLKFLLLLMLLTGLLNAQEPNRSLVISEVRMDGITSHYVELTNMGDTPINLGEFKIAAHDPWATPINDVWNDPWIPFPNSYYFLPEVTLPAGESYVITVGFDFGPKQYNKKVYGFEGSERPKQIEIYDLADLIIHQVESESFHPEDSVTLKEDIPNPRNTPDPTGYFRRPHMMNGRECLYIEHHFAEGDSAVVDQVNGVFDCGGLNCAGQTRYDVAGVTNASSEAILIRKFSVKTGNLDFANARGVGLGDSEWIPILKPEGYNSWRDLWWTVGNHGPYVLDENTLESDVIDVDFANKTLTVPWGVRRLDDIMRHIEKKPGIAWDYHLNPNREDSVFLSAQTGDKITIYVCGEELTSATFDIVVSEPTADANIVVPIAHIDIASVREGGPIRNNTQLGIEGLAWPRVTNHDHGNDTITGTWHGLPNALRTDSLLKYLEKPDNASWEFVWVDDTPRPDLKNGDKLKVVSENGSIKEYFLQVQEYYPSFNANLSAIHWPDIPDFYKGIFGWMGDTIPNFSPSSYNYRVEVPLDANGIPHLVAKTEDLNAKVDVKRATNLSGTKEDRTVSFTVTAENDTTTNTYNVELYKQKDPENLQDWKGEPILSEFVFREQWNNNFAEIFNPGNQPLDLSNYLVTMAPTTNPAEAITRRSGEDEWLFRYDKYIPGYKYVSQDQWAITPGIVEPDLNVNPILGPGEVFVYSYINNDVNYYNGAGKSYWDNLREKIDVNFSRKQARNEFHNNPWDEPISGRGPVGYWVNNSIFIFKILNDSIKLGLKPANDPNDFELIEAFGMADGSDWVVAGVEPEQVMNWKRKPEIYKPNPQLQASFGTNADDSEWIVESEATWEPLSLPWPLSILMVSSDIGQHFMNEPTHFKSTVSSVVYKVSEGYSMEEKIWGITTGTNVATFLDNIIKENENQTLTVKSGDTELGMDDLLTMNDVLVVLSADSANTTQYILELSEEGLSSDAVLTSDLYEIEITDEPLKSATNDENAGAGYITGFEYGTQLSTVLNNVNVPAGASLNIIDGEGAFIPLKMLNFDTTYVTVTVNPDTYFNVVAENGITSINYQLQPRASENDAFILSDIYMVVQKDNLIHYVPRGTNVFTLLSNIVPSFGATVKVVDKMGLERTEGTIYEDDKVLVTSSNGEVTRVYHLAMLRTQYIIEPAYLAYVLSNFYQVDQVNYEITGPSGTTLLTEFYERITPAMGATAVVVDAEGNEKTSGDLNVGDMLKVTSKDGKIEVMYALNLGTSAVEPESNQIEIYPNPTNGRLNIGGVKQGNRIQVFNATGAMIRDLKVQSNLEVLSIDNQPSGIYMIVISNENNILGRFKAIKQ